MKKFFLTTTLFATAMSASVYAADDVILPQGMTPLLPKGVEITSSYLAQNIMSITKDEKPLVVTENKLMYFTAQDEQHGEELWVSNGTPEGTKMVCDIFPGVDGSDPRWLTVIGNKVYFSATTPEFGAELWVTDGTAEGTKMVKDIYDVAEGEGSEPQGLTNFYGKLLFFAMDEESEALPVIDAEKSEKWLWISDGTAEGTKRIADTPTRMDNMDGTCGYIVTCNGKGIFAGYDAENNETIWATDGTAEGTAPLLNINPKPGDGNPFLTGAASIDHLVSVDDRLAVFRAIVTAELYGEDMGVEIWTTDGTPENTKFIGIDINKVESSGNPGTCDYRQTYAFGNKLYFRCNDGINGAEAWVYDIDQPIAAGVNPRMVKEISHFKGKVSYNAHTSCFYPYQGYVYVATMFTYHKYNPETEKDDLSQSGYHSLARFNESNYDEFEGALTWGGFEIFEGGQEWCHQFTTLNDIMFWSCQDELENIELWKLEGTNGIPTKVIDFPGDGQVNKTRSISNSLYFVSNGMKQLYRYNTDGSTVNNPTDTPAAVAEIAATNAVCNFDGNVVEVKGGNVAAIRVFSATGSCVAANSASNQISLTNIVPGVYLVNVVMTDGTSQVKKVVKH